LNDTVPLSSSPERAAGEERKVLLFFFCLSLTSHACQNRPPMHPHDGKNQGSRALPAPLISQPTRCRGRAAKPCSPGAAIGWQ